MGFIIKPVVTEKMNAVTEKSSVDKTIKVANEKSAKKHNAVAETRNYVVKNKRHPEGLKKEKTVYSYVKQAHLLCKQHKKKQISPNFLKLVKAQLNTSS